MSTVRGDNFIKIGGGGYFKYHYIFIWVIIYSFTYIYGCKWGDYYPLSISIAFNGSYNSIGALDSST